MRSSVRWLLYLGIVVAVVGLGLVHSRLIATPPYSYTGTSRFGWSMLYIGLLAITAYGVGLPEVARTPKQALVAATGAAVGGALLISVVQLFAGDALLPRFTVLGSGLVLVPWYLICAALATDSETRAERRDRALIISDHVEASLVRDEVSRSPERPVRLVAVLPIQSVVTEPGGDALPLIDAVEQQQVSVIVLDRDAQAVPSIVSQAAMLHENGVRVRTLSLFYEQWLGMISLAELERVSLMFDIGEIHRTRYGRLKRVLDVALAALCLGAVVVAVPIVIAGNLVANRGPLFYRQERVGKNGRRFHIWKFRTMTAGSQLNEWTSEQDPRITPFGRVLRVTHLDELPQALNILVGDLSVVGPRPEQPHYVEELSAKLPFYDMRHLVRPGLTGWAQVKYGYAGDERDALEKLQYEFFYLRHQSLALDLRIVGRTIRSVLGGEGR